MGKFITSKPYLLLGLIMFIVFGIDFATNGLLSGYGAVRPRMTENLLGIFTYSFLHGSWQHIMSNIFPFLIMGFFLCRNLSNNAFYMMFLFVTVFSGICIWLFGASNSAHVGASGVIFGMWSAIITFALKRREFKDILVGALIGLFYGFTFIYGLIPQDGISFAGHFYGLLGGVIFSVIYINAERVSLPAKK